MLKIAMIAGEASGDMLASSLIKAIRNSSLQSIEFVGIGGKMMQNEGFISWHNMELLSVMGYVEVLKSLPQLLALRYKVLQQLLDYQPDVFIGVDAPDFNFFLEDKLKQKQIKTIHYISPTIWAWRYNRIFKIKKSTDLMLCIFPFEEEIYHKVGMDAKFIGHPMANQIELEIDTNYYRSQLSLPIDKVIFTVMCGSRKREIKSIANILINTCSLINAQIPHILFIFPFSHESVLLIMQKYLTRQKLDFEYKLILDKTREVIKASDFIMAKSGTVSLECALCKKPMLIYYKISKFTAWLIRKKISIKHVGQPNIIMGREIVPEFLQENANPVMLSNYMINLYKDKVKQQQMIMDFYQLHKVLLQNASVEGANAVLSMVQA